MTYDQQEERNIIRGINKSTARWILTCSVALGLWIWRTSSQHQQQWDQVISVNKAQEDHLNRVDMDREQMKNDIQLNRAQINQLLINQERIKEKLNIK